MQTHYKKYFLNTLTILGIVFCVVFAAPLKTVIDSFELNKKSTSELLEEEGETETGEEDSKTETEKLDVKKHDDFHQYYSYNTAFFEILNFTHYTLLKITHPYFKVHTPPPDIIFLA